MTVLGLDVAAAERWFEVNVPGFEGPLTASAVLGGRSNLTYVVRGVEPGKAWALRRPPLGEVAPTANDLGREFRVVSALRAAGVPVAAPVGWCEDTSVIGAPFSVMGWVPGRVIRTASDAAQLSPADAEGCAHALIAELVKVHSVDITAPPVVLLGRPDGFVERQVRRWAQQWDLVKTREVDGVYELQTRLEDRIPMVSMNSVVHGDYRIDNTILMADDPTRVAAIVDWEMATLGDPLTDLAMLLVYWDPVSAPVLPDGHPISANPGFPSADAMADRYAAESGRPIDGLDFFLGLAYFKLATIAEGIHRRYGQGLTVGDGFETVGDAVGPLVDRGLEHVSGVVP